MGFKYSIILCFVSIVLAAPGAVIAQDSAGAVPEAAPEVPPAASEADVAPAAGVPAAPEPAAKEDVANPDCEGDACAESSGSGEVGTPKGVEPQKPRAHWRLSSQFASRINPVGLRLSTMGSWRIPLSSSEHILLKGTYIDFGAGLPVTPVSLFPTAYVEIVPIAPVVLRAEARQMTYLGLLGNLATFDQGQLDAVPDANPNAYWTPTELEALRDEGGGDFAMGIDYTLTATLRLKVKRFLVKGSFEQHWLTIDLPDGKVRWYDSTADMIFKASDELRVAKGLLAYLAYGELSAKEFLLLGSTYEYQNSDVENLTRKLVGALVVWRPGWWASSRFSTGMLAQHYLQDAGDHRTGEFTVAVFSQVSWDGIPKK